MPVIALHGRIVHLCVLIESKPSRYDHQPWHKHRQWENSGPTSRTSSSPMQCSTSDLFRKTNKLAPVNRWRLVRLAASTVGVVFAPLLKADRRAPLGNRPHGGDQWHRLPRLVCRSFQSNFSSRIEGFFAPQHPLWRSVRSSNWEPVRLTNVEFISMPG